MAAVQLTLTVPSEHVSRILAAFNATTDTDIVITAQGNNDTPNGDFSGSHHVRIEEKSPGENNTQFAKRFIRHIVLTMIRLYEQSLDQTRHDDEVLALDPVTVDVPDDIIV